MANTIQNYCIFCIIAEISVNDNTAHSFSYTAIRISENAKPNFFHAKTSSTGIVHVTGLWKRTRSSVLSQKKYSFNLPLATFTFVKWTFAILRGVTRLDGVRGKKQVWRSNEPGVFGSKCTALVGEESTGTLLGLFSAPRSDSAPL